MTDKLRVNIGDVTSMFELRYGTHREPHKIHADIHAETVVWLLVPHEDRDFTTASMFTINIHSKFMILETLLKPTLSNVSTVFWFKAIVLGEETVFWSSL